MTPSQFYKGKTMAVTGAAGTVGSALVARLLELGAERVFGLDNNEGELFLLTEVYTGNPHFEGFLCDVTELETFNVFLSGVDYVFHAAAFKNVPVCERSPSLAVRSNITGTQNVITAARQHNVRRVLFTSSDKAVNPTNVMGTTKLMGERLITAANSLNQSDRTVFASTRFGNVAGSRGSVVPLFVRQIAKGGPVTLTDKQMTRFFMTLEEATNLLLESMMLVQGGEAFVTKMPVFRVIDLANAMIEEVAPMVGRDPKSIDIVEIGPRVGEKMYEELMTEEEVGRTYEVEHLLVVLPAFRNIYDQIDYSPHVSSGRKMERAYNSENEQATSVEDVRAFVRSLDLKKELAS